MCASCLPIKRVNYIASPEIWPNYEIYPIIWLNYNQIPWKAIPYFSLHSLAFISRSPNHFSVFLWPPLIPRTHAFLYSLYLCLSLPLFWLIPLFYNPFLVFSLEIESTRFSKNKQDSTWIFLRYFNEAKRKKMEMIASLVFQVHSIMLGFLLRHSLSNISSNRKTPHTCCYLCFSS